MLRTFFSQGATSSRKHAAQSTSLSRIPAYGICRGGSSRGIDFGKKPCSAAATSSSATSSSLATAAAATSATSRRGLVTATIPQRGGNSSSPAPPPFARLPRPQQPLHEEHELLWHDPVAPELCIDFDAPQISKGQGLLLWASGIGFFVAVGLFVKYVIDPPSKASAVKVGTQYPFNQLHKELGGYALPDGKQRQMQDGDNGDDSEEEEDE